MVARSLARARRGCGSEALPGRRPIAVAAALPHYPRRPEKRSAQSQVPDDCRGDGYLPSHGPLVAGSARAAQLREGKADGAVTGYPHQQVEKRICIPEQGIDRSAEWRYYDRQSGRIVFTLRLSTRVFPDD